MNITYACQYSGHEEEPIIGLCLFKDCDSKPQYCNECLKSQHSSHQKYCKSMIKIKFLIKGIQQELSDWLSNIEQQYKQIQRSYQQTVKLLTSEKTRMIEFDKYLQNEEYNQITEKISVFKQINAISEIKQDIKSMNILEMLKYINDQLNSLKLDQQQILTTHQNKSEINQEFPRIEDSKIQKNQSEQEKETAQLMLNSVIKTQEGIKGIILSGKNNIDNCKYIEAISTLDKAIQLNNKNFEAYIQKGVALTYLKRQKEAIICFDQAISLDQNQKEAYYNKGVSLNDLKLYEEAIVCYDIAIQLDQKYKEAYNKKGVSLRCLDRYENAIICYNQAIQLDPYYKFAYNNKGVALKNLNRYEEAIQCLDKAIYLDQKYKDAYNNKGNVLRNLSRYEEAIICYDKAIQLDQKYKDAYNNKGMVLEHLKRYQEAIICYDQVISLDPSCTEAIGNKRIALLAIEKSKEALQKPIKNQ